MSEENKEQSNFSYELKEDISKFLNLRYQDGYWSNKLSNEPKKLGSSLNLDLGTNFLFDLFKKNDLQISAGIYNILGFIRENPIFVYNNAQGVYTIVKAPVTGTMQINFVY